MRPVAKYAPIDFESEIDRIVCSARESERLQTGQAELISAEKKKTHGLCGFEGKMLMRDVS